MSTAPLTYSELDRDSFDRITEAFSDVVVPLEQTPAWMEFEKALGRRPLGIWAYWDAAGELVATASFIQVTRPSRESVVVVNGPVWFTERTPPTELLLMDTVRAQFHEEQSLKPLYVRMQVAHLQQPAMEPLEHGWYEREIVVDLTLSEPDLLKSFGSNARNRIARAQRSGVETKQIPKHEWKDVFTTELFPIMQETAERGGFRSFDSHYYETLLTTLADHLRLLVAYHEGTPVSWLITTEYRNYAVYYFAGSSHAARKTFAPYLLLWEAFKVLKAAGNTACGMTGIESENFPSLANVTAFKRNFSKNIVTVPTTYDIPIYPTRYSLVATLLRGRRAAPSLVRAAVRRAADSARHILQLTRETNHSPWSK